MRRACEVIVEGDVEDEADGHVEEVMDTIGGATDVDNKHGGGRNKAG